MEFPLKLFRSALRRVRSLGFQGGATLSALGLPLTRDQRLLRQAKNSYVGRIGFLIGSGPSVRTEDLDALSGRIAFCCNRFFLAYDKTRFRPNCLVSSDRQMIDDFGLEILTRGGCDVWFVDERKPQIPGNFYWVRSDWSRPFRFFRDVRFGAGVGGATLVAATQIGYHLGIRHFFLYGVDHSFKFQKVEDSLAGLKTAQGDGNHFIANYRSGKPWVPPQMELIEEGFHVCDQELRKEGGWIKNATRGGALEVLERVSFEEALRFSDPVASA